MPTHLHIAPPPTASLENHIADAGITMDDDDEFEDVMTNGNDEDEKENYRCWMQRLLSACALCPTEDSPTMRNKFNSTLPAAAALMLLADVPVFGNDERDDWFDAVGGAQNVSTVGFAGFPDNTPVVDQ